MIVSTYTTKNGVTIRFLDDGYRDRTPEQLERVREEIRRTAWRIAEAKAARQRAGSPEEEAKDTSSVSPTADSFPSRGSHDSKEVRT